jgi:two-component system, cell cycle sensor histidine kinase and response regulator CckA
MALADPTQIHQVVVNLCTNAAHAMEEKGVLDITILNVDLPEKELSASSLLTLKPGRYIRLRISDTGTGISADTLSRIFEPYFTTKGVGKGSGLGLAVVHGIVKRHGGDIRVLSKPGQGSVFEVLIPATEEVQPPETRASQALPGGSERVLLVDDEPVITELGEKMLKRLGYHVSSITSSPEALDLFRSNPSGFDLVITDYTMPHMSGTDLAREIKRIQPDIPVILCTGISERITEEMLREAGIQELAPKPLNKTLLAELVRKVLDSRLMT